MRWDLFALCLLVWISFGAHFVMASRVRQAMDIGLVEPSGAAARLVGVSKSLTGLALLNALVFAVAFGWKASWFAALVVVLGSYVVALLYAYLLRGSLYERALGLTHRLGWVLLPLCSLGLWLVAFDGRPRDLQSCIQEYAVPAILPRAVMLAEQACAKTLDPDVVGSELQRELCVLKGARDARNDAGLRTLRVACASEHTADRFEMRRVAERSWLHMPACPRSDNSLYANPADLARARQLRASDSRTICGFKSFRSVDDYIQRRGFMLAPPHGYYFENSCAIECRFRSN